jgi:hypothetical protein
MISVAALAAFLLSCKTEHSVSPTYVSPTVIKNSHFLLWKCIQEIQTIGIGSTREDLTRYFKPCGGLSTRSKGRYLYMDCEYIYVDVEFEPVVNQTGLGVQHTMDWPPKDLILSISKPCVGLTASD